MINLLSYIFIPLIVLPIDINKVADSSKFWFIQNLYDALLSLGINVGVANAIVFTIVLLALAAIVWLLNIAIGRFSFLFVKDQKLNVESGVYRILMKHGFFKRFFVFIAIGIVVLSCRILFSGFSIGLITFVMVLSRSVMIIWILLLLYSLLDSWNTFFELHPKTQQKSLKGYIQLMKIIAAVVAVVFILAIIVDKEPSNLILGFGATAAFITLIFKDTILGFVASIQLSFQDMIRPDDWIEMPSKNADGIIVDINLSSVKVQNWDNSVTMIPIYALVTDSFTNWRRMEQGPGRLFVRSFNVDAKSVKFAGESLLESLSKHSVTGGNYAEFLTLAHVSSPDAILTNLALFRAHLELFLRRHPQINDQLMLFVRYLNAISGQGIGIEIYAFSKQKEAAGYDTVHRTVMEYVIASASLFEIILFQSPSGEDLHRLGKFRDEKFS
ncbi:mechanosensitive ion channel family protein [Dysgonomonas alginatilytica]|nr:mechanosensitive ion channel domain-containing protein [Dysgonomonas alginatilytica]